MSATSERIRTPQIRTPQTGTSRRPGRGGWAVVAIALVLSVAAGVLLLRPSGTTEPASAGRVEIAAAQAHQIWSLKAAQGRLLATAGAAQLSARTVARTFEPVATASEWNVKSAFGQARLAVVGPSVSSTGSSVRSTSAADWAAKAEYGRGLLQAASAGETG
jgi:hypothetical protein